MIEFPMLDAHVHLWDPERLPMPWLRSAPGLDRAFDVAEYRARTSGLPLTGLVYVEVGVAPAFALLEATHIAALAQREPDVVAIVAATPLEYGATTRSYLDALRALGPTVKGVRRNVQGEPDPAFCLQPSFVEGVRMLSGYHFTCDLCVRHHQLASVVELVRQCPEVNFVLDHLGKPDIKHGTLEPWRTQMAQLAACPNVRCKLSGLVTEADPQRWSVDDLRPYVAHTVEVFGPQRVMFGSDWPVVLQASSHARWIAALRELLADLPPEHQRSVWHDTAQRFYRVNEGMTA